MSGLSKAHAVHRDLKPANILMDSKGIAFIADLGLAKVYNSFESMNNTNDIDPYGTETWMAPETREKYKKKNQNCELKGKPSKSDIFCLGLIALFCLDYIKFLYNHLNYIAENLQSYFFL